MVTCARCLASKTLSGAFAHGGRAGLAAMRSDPIDPCPSRATGHAHQGSPLLPCSHMRATYVASVAADGLLRLLPGRLSRCADRRHGAGEMCGAGPTQSGPSRRQIHSPSPISLCAHAEDHHSCLAAHTYAATKSSPQARPSLHSPVARTCQQVWGPNRMEMLAGIMYWHEQMRVHRSPTHD